MDIDLLAGSIAGILREGTSSMCAACLTLVTGQDNTDVRVAMMSLALGPEFQLTTTCGRCGAVDARCNPILYGWKSRRLLIGPLRCEPGPQA